MHFIKTTTKRIFEKMFVLGKTFYLIHDLCSCGLSNIIEYISPYFTKKKTRHVQGLLTIGSQSSCRVSFVLSKHVLVFALTQMAFYFMKLIREMCHLSCIKVNVQSRNQLCPVGNCTQKQEIKSPWTDANRIQKLLTTNYLQQTTNVQ